MMECNYKLKSTDQSWNIKSNGQTGHVTGRFITFNKKLLIWSGGSSVEVENLRFLCLTVWMGEGSLGGDSPALFTAIVLYWTLSFNERLVCL